MSALIAKCFVFAIVIICLQKNTCSSAQSCDTESNCSDIYGHLTNVLKMVSQLQQENEQQAAELKSIKTELNTLKAENDVMKGNCTSCQGAPGAKGDTGVPGPPGVNGVKGDNGQQGVAGPKGANGVKGDNGQQGVKGAAGAKGDKGVAGPPGVNGVKGDNGQQGVAGLKGANGVKGDNGQQGVKGQKGDVGPKGAADLSPNIAFSALRTTALGPVTTRTTVTFNRVLLNEGGAFSNPSSIFKATIPGVYQFHFGGLSAGFPGVKCVLQLIKNGAIIVRGYGTSSPYGTSGDQNINNNCNNMVLLELTTGDEISVQLHPSALVRLYGNSDPNTVDVYSSFSGHIIYAK